MYRYKYFSGGTLKKLFLKAREISLSPKSGKLAQRGLLSLIRSTELKSNTDAILVDVILFANVTVTLRKSREINSSDRSKEFSSSQMK